MNDDGLRRDYFRLFGISKDEFERRLGKIGFGDCYKVKVSRIFLSEIRICHLRAYRKSICGGIQKRNLRVKGYRA